MADENYILVHKVGNSVSVEAVIAGETKEKMLVPTDSVRSVLARMWALKMRDRLGLKEVRIRELKKTLLHEIRLTLLKK